MIKVLFIDAEHGSRSRMSAAILNKFGKAKFLALSAGLKAGYRNAYAEEVMRETGLDISNVDSKDIGYFVSRGFTFQYIIELHGQQSETLCRLFSNAPVYLHWNFMDPVTFEGPESAIVQKYRELRNLIRTVVIHFIKEFEPGKTPESSDLNFITAHR